MAEPETDTDRPGGVRVGTVLGETYELARLIGQGGMGAVWEAKHLRLPGKRVAVKVLLATLSAGSEAWTRFKREAEIATKIGHANIVEVLDFNVTPSGAPYLVLELLHGESLAQRMARGPMPLAEVVPIVRQIGSALHAAHREGVVHRDLKPENVYLVPAEEEGPPRVKVLDFGISKITGSTTLQTQEQRILGTPQYMSPEQARGHNSAVDARTDVFALGAIAYEMLSGKPAFSGENLAEVVFKVVYEKPVPLRELAPGAPPEVLAAVDKAMEKEATARFADIAAMVAAMTGKPLASVERRAARSSDQAFAATVGSTDGPAPKVTPSSVAAAAAKAGQQEAFAPTVSSQDVPVPARLSTPRPEATVDTRSGGRGAKLAGVGLLLVAAVAGTYVLATRGKAASPAVATADAPPRAVVAPDATIAAVVPAPPDAAVAAVVPAAPDAATVAVTPARPDAGAVAKKPPVDKPPPDGDADADDAPPAQDEGTAKQWLDQAQAAFKAGNYAEAIRLARRSLNEKPTVRAFSVMARSYCGLGDLGNARAQLGKLGPVEKKRVLRYCKGAGVDLTE